MIFYIHTDTKWTLSRVLTKTNQTIVTKLVWLLKSERASDQLDVNLLRPQAAAAALARTVDLESVESRASHPSGSALAILQPVVAVESWPAARVWLGGRAARNSIPALAARSGGEHSA